MSKSTAGFKADFHSIFVEEWPPYIGAVLLVFVIIALMASKLWWGIFGGFKLWGDWLNSAIGLSGPLGIAPPDSPLMHHMSLMNITLVIGAFAAALISRQFLINRPPLLEYVTAAFGGTLMGLGAVLAGGCTTGGFFTPVLHSSLSGWVMCLGLIFGALIGVKMLFWVLENVTWGMKAPKMISIPQKVQSIYPLLGVIVLVAIIYWATQWYYSSDTSLNVRAIVIVAGFAMGFIMHRSRLCFARAFREPFVTGEATMTKAIMLGILVAVPMAAILFKGKVLDPYLAIPPRFWIGSLLGGLVFGIGMIFAGGCASGSLWRMGEGHVKLWMAGLFFAWTGSIFYGLLKKANLIVSEPNLTTMLDETRLGVQSYLPADFGSWGIAFAIAAVFLLVWYILLRYNESTGKFTVV
jgi:uncharacterized protein